MNIQHLKNISSVKKFAPKTTIVKEGREGETSMYIILDGTVTVTKNQERIAQLKAGDFFGEMTLFLERKRSATVTTETDVIALEINRDNAYLFFGSELETTFDLIASLCARLEDLDSKYVQAAKEVKTLRWTR
jgi:CRP-like cAMP-binding protein